MIYHVRNWHRYQREFITRALRERRRRAVARYRETGELPDRLDGPHPMTYLRIDVNIDAEVDALAALGLGDRAEGILVRLLRYVARTDALRGEVHSTSGAPRNAVGRLWGSIFGASPEFALKALDALVSRRILVEGTCEQPQWLQELTRIDTIPDEASKASHRDGTRDGTHHHTRAGGRDPLVRARQERNSPYTPHGGGPAREVDGSPSARAAGRPTTHGVEEAASGEPLGEWTPSDGELGPPIPLPDGTTAPNDGHRWGLANIRRFVGVGDEEPWGPVFERWARTSLETRIAWAEAQGLPRVER